MKTRSRLHAIASSVILMSGLAGCVTYPGDAKITADVEARFREHAATEPPNMINVQTVNHVVYLSGLVNTSIDSDAAERVVREVPGVTDVVSSIGLTP